MTPSFRSPSIIVAVILCGALALPSPGTAQTPGATPTASASAPSLYERLGGYDAIVGFVGLVFPRVANHPRLAHLFRGHGLDSQERQFQLVVEMVCRATGGPCAYLGRDMERVHDGLGITDELWTVFMDIIDDGIREVGIPEPAAGEFRQMWMGFRGSVVRGGP